MTKVTVYVPVYNTAKYVRECLDSILAQTWPDIEIIVLDEGSTDGSREICREYEEEYDQIRLIEKDRPSGSCGDINYALSFATGQFACKMDSDDIMMEDYWYTVLPYFIRPEVGFVSAGMVIITEKGEVIRGGHLPALSATPKDIFISNKVYAASPFRMKMFGELGGWDIGRPHPDWDFWIRCFLSHWKVAYCVQPIYFYRMRPESIERSLTKEVREETLNYYREKHKDAMAKLGLKPAPKGSDQIGVDKNESTILYASSTSGANPLL